MSKKDNGPIDAPGHVNVPIGGAAIGVFDITPKTPSDGKARDWKLEAIYNGKATKVKEMVVRFEPESEPYQERYERAVLVFHIAEGAQSKKCRWSFAGDGIQYEPGQEDNLHNIEPKVSADGQVLTLTIHDFNDNSETVDFRFTAQCENLKSGEVLLFNSPDPGIRIGRPPGP
ncbi:DP-EP family protein [Gilvimarinus agarilyticus]|uniref:DP-EP family protein n=1 Tax=Gilvimarinus agarilyticus TaxID=679259 RepID=UPI0005A14F79|nr:DP-EP family protein [Gilvimarinus agarilyticus]